MAALFNWKKFGLFVYIWCCLVDKNMVGVFVLSLGCYPIVRVNVFFVFRRYYV